MSFKDLGLNEQVLDALIPLGYETPTPIQEQAIPHVLEGHDILGSAQTGTGKTAAFTLPMVHILSSRPSNSQGRSKPIRALILTPTRELASQIDENVRNYSAKTNIKSTVVFGGIPQRRQVDALRRGIDILVATPGRLLDLCNQGFIRLADVELLVLDEADTMLDMGFIHDIKKIIKQCPEKRQTLFFSATMPDNIRELSSSILTDPVRIQIAAVSSAAETVKQEVYYVRQSDKKDLLVHVLESDNISNALVFTRTKFGADKVVRHLQNNNIASEAIHGNKSQPQRERALNKFRKGRVRVLVATDIASRGIDVDELSHVINFELPNLSESYIHRIGRTGRAGREGTAISFCNEGEERNHLRGIQKLIGREIELIEDQPFNMPMDPVGMTFNSGGGGGKKKSRNRGGSKNYGRSSYGSSNDRGGSRGGGGRPSRDSRSEGSSRGYGRGSSSGSGNSGESRGYSGSSFGQSDGRSSRGYSNSGGASSDNNRGGYSRDNNRGGDNRGGYSRDDNRGGFSRDNSRGGDNRGGFSRDNSRGGDNRGGFSRDNSRGGDNRGGYSRDDNRGSDNRGGYSRDNNSGGDNRGGYSRDNNQGSDNRGGYSRDNNRGSDSRGGYSRDNNSGGDNRGGGGFKKGGFKKSKFKGNSSSPKSGRSAFNS